MGWLHGARRLASAASRPAGVLLLEAPGVNDVEAVHAQALDLALRRAGFRVLALSSELGRERLERALQALEPTAIVLCGAAGQGAGAGNLLQRIRDVGVAAPLYGFRVPDLDSEESIVSANTPTEVTQALNADLRRRAAGAFA
jgi:hypothetical protein